MEVAPISLFKANHITKLETETQKIKLEDLGDSDEKKTIKKKEKTSNETKIVIASNLRKNNNLISQERRIEV